MLWARLISDSVRALDPGVCSGTYTPEEIGDMGDGPAPNLVVVKDETTPPPAATARQANEPERPEPRAGKAKAKAEAEKPEPEPVDAELVDDGDYSTMPAGNKKGEPWTSFNDAQLLKVLAVEHPAITEKHKAAVQAELDRRNNGEGADPGKDDLPFKA